MPASVLPDEAPILLYGNDTLKGNQGDYTDAEIQRKNQRVGGILDRADKLSDLAARYRQLGYGPQPVTVRSNNSNKGIPNGLQSDR